jgi:hypothetical protein
VKLPAPDRWNLPQAINLATVADGDDEDHEHVVPHLVKSPIVTGANAEAGIVTQELSASLRTRILRKRIDEGE